MFIEVDVEAGENCADTLMLRFNAVADPRPAPKVWTPGPDGRDTLCVVTGWSEQGPCPAYVALVEESGEGTALLVYGGEQGIRLKPAVSAEEWDLSSPRQWGEPCLLLPTGAEAS